MKGEGERRRDESEGRQAEEELSNLNNSAQVTFWSTDVLCAYGHKIFLQADTFFNVSFSCITLLEMM